MWQLDLKKYSNLIQMTLIHVDFVGIDRSVRRCQHVCDDLRVGPQLRSIRCEDVGVLFPLSLTTFSSHDSFVPVEREPLDNVFFVIVINHF